MPRIPLNVVIDSRDGALTKGPLLTNGFVEPIGEGKYKIFKRPGMASVVDLGSGLGQGITSFLDDTGTEILYAVQNGTLYYSDVAPSTGTWTGEALPYTNGYAGGFTTFLGDIGLVYDGDTYSKTGIGASWVKIAENPFSSNTTPRFTFVEFNGKLYACGYLTQGATACVYSTVDGITWTQLTTSPPWPVRASGAYPSVVLFENKLWYLGTLTGSSGASYTNAVYNSVDGITWTLVNGAPSWGGTGDSTTGTALFNASFCVGLGKMWLAGGLQTNVLSDNVYSSTDGVTWTTVTSAAGFGVRMSGTMLQVGPSLLMIGGLSNTGGTAYDNLYTSTDGATWTLVSATVNFDNNLSCPFGIQHSGRIIVYNSESVPAAREMMYPESTTAGGASLGTVNIGAGDFVDFSRNYAGDEIMIRLNNQAFKLVPATSVVTQITDTDYPTITVRGNPYLNGRWYVMDPDGTIYNSAEDDSTSWPGDYVSAEFEPDGGVALSKFGPYIVAFGRYTIELFWDAQNETGSPISAVESGTMLVGCAHGNSVAQSENTVIFMGQRKGQGTTFQKGRFVAILEGGTYNVVSTASISRVLDEDDLDTVNSCVLAAGGHTWYVLTLGTSSLTLVYDMDTKLWYKWTRRTAGSAVSVSSITQTSGVATVTCGAAHGLSDGDPVTIAGANQAGYNGLVNATYVSTTVFTYPVDSGTASPATGTITATPSTESSFNFVASCNYNGKQVFQEASGGGIYEMDLGTYLDDSQPIDVRVRTSLWDADNNMNKFQTWLEIIGDKVDTEALIRTTDDDYGTYSTYRRITMDDPRAGLFRWGYFRRRAFEIRHTANADFRVEGLETNLEQGYV